jgi:hypothetical protein
MAYEEVLSLESDVTYSLGKLNKKTGKTDPKSVEGYYIGNRKVETRLGDSLIHFFKTKTGNVAVWGTNDLNRKLQNIKLGTMVKAEFVGMKDTPRGEMRYFKVSQDKNNFIEVDSNLSAAPQVEDAEEYAENDEVDDNDDGEQTLPSGYGQNVSSAQSTQLTTAERAAKVQALLNKNKK